MDIPHGQPRTAIAAGPRQYSQSWFRVRSGPMTIFLFFPRLLHVFKWGLGSLSLLNSCWPTSA
jgi:hypothetical protein